MQTIGKYHIVRELGAGGMGVVYVGQHERLGKPVAIKVVTPELSADRDIIQRFFNEATAATRIRHPGIIEVFDYGEDEHTSAAYFVMELLEGEPLSARIKRDGHMPAEVIARLGAQMADTLAAAHDAGIVHRDLKPDNLFLVPDRAVAGGIRVKILDFGIAKLVVDQLNASSLTGTSAVMGTPAYMSPEQARGSSGTVDHRSDIYSLGCVLYHMACGQVPFPGLGLGEVLGAHLHVAPTPPRVYAPALPPQLEALILGCLAKDPAARPPNMRAVCGALEAMAQPTLTTTMGRGQVHVDTRPPARGTRRWVAPVAVGAVLTIGVAITLLALRSESKNESSSDDLDDSTALISPENDKNDKDDPKNLQTNPFSNSGVDAANPWIPIAPPAEPVVLGVPADTAEGMPGFRPQRAVRTPAQPYDIQRHEVTWGELDPWLADNAPDAVTRPDWVPADAAARERLPATGVPWAIARRYCASVGGRLPTEEEWELAARGPRLRPHAWGDRRLDLDRTRAYAGNNARVAAVETQTQDTTPDGIRDLMGNAQEWTVDLWRDNEPGTDESWVQADGMTFRAIRGLPLAAAPPAALPTHGGAYREPLCAAGPCVKDAQRIVQYVGFRCARDRR